METSIYLGMNTSKVSFSHFLTLRFFGKKGYEQNETSLTTFFNNISGWRALNYNMEKGVEPSILHIHVLADVIDTTLFHEQLISSVNPYKINTGTRTTLAKIKKCDKDLKNDVYFKDCWIDVDYTEYFGKKITVEIESLIDTINASNYCYKYCSYGITNGYLQKS
jgi:hypothetical protein